jgi:hypothetical protein
MGGGAEMEIGGAGFIVVHDGAAGAEPWHKSGEPARRSFRGRSEETPSVPVSIGGFWASGSLRDDPAGFRGDEPDRRCLQPNARVRLSSHGLCDAGDRAARVPGVGPSHAHLKPQPGDHGELFFRHHGDRGSNPREGVLVDRQHVGWFDRAGNAGAVGDWIYFRLYRGR